MNQLNLAPGRWKSRIRLFCIGGIIGMVTILLLFSLPGREVNAQQPTGSIPTVTGTRPGPFVTVYSDKNLINVYNGPGFDSYTQIGILVSGQSVPAIGQSTDTSWIEIIYIGVPGGKGWIYAPYVKLTAGASLPSVDSPPTATPGTTPTIDPTYVAAFGVELAPTKLPTFTSPPSLKVPTFTASVSSGSKLPFGLIILSLVLIGVLGAIVSFLRGSR